MRDSKTVLIVGFGDAGKRVARLLKRQYRVIALIRKPDKARVARRMGIQVVRGDLDQPHSLKALNQIGQLAGLRVCHFAPPPSKGIRDTRTRNLIAALWPAKPTAKRAMLSRVLPTRMVYVSTSGVYGDCGGSRVDETRHLNPKTARARRRVDAERTLVNVARRAHVRLSVLRAPGIVSESRLPLERLRRGTPALAAEDDVYVNHIHAEDLARVAVAALRLARRGRVFNCVDDQPQKMADYFDRVAMRAGLPKPKRVTRLVAERTLPATLYSFMDESRRLSNARLKRELKFQLRFPSVDVLLDQVFGPTNA